MAKNQWFPNHLQSIVARILFPDKELKIKFNTCRPKIVSIFEDTKSTQGSTCKFPEHQNQLAKIGYQQTPTFNICDTLQHVPNLFYF